MLQSQLSQWDLVSLALRKRLPRRALLLSERTSSDEDSFVDTDDNPLKLDGNGR